MPTLLLPLILAALAGGADLGPGLRIDTLAAGIQREAPWVDEATALEHAEAAIAHERPDLPAELMLAIAWRESKYDPTARPDCGVMQVTRKNLGGSRAACAAARADAAAGYQVGADAFGRWVDQCQGDRKRRVSVLRCALNGYAEGTAAGRRGWGVKGCKRARCDRAAGPLARARRIAAPAPPISDV